MQQRTLSTRTVSAIDLGGVFLPTPGASRPASIRDSAAAADLELTADEVATLWEA